MIVERKKQKLVHAIIFFIKNTKYCYTLKLFKLLYFLDFEHYKQTGRSVTGQDYYAWPMGPVPNSLYDDIKNKNPELIKSISIIPQSEIDPDFKNEKTLTFRSRIKLDEDFFSKRETNIMNNLIEIYKETQSKDMTLASHETNSPWDYVYNKEGKKNALIPYLYALKETEGISKEEAEEIESDDNEMKINFAG